MIFGKRLKTSLQICKRFVGQYSIDGAQGPLLDRQQLIGPRNRLGRDIVHQGHEEVELCFFPEVLPLIGVRGILDDDFCNGLYQILVLFDATQAVPCVAVLHVQKIKHFHLIALFSQKRRGAFIEFSLGVHADQTFLCIPFCGTLEDKGLHQTACLSGTRSAISHDVFSKAAVGTQRYIFGVLVGIVRIVLLLPQDRPGQLRDRTGQQDLFLFFF